MTQQPQVYTYRTAENLADWSTVNTTQLGQITASMRKPTVNLSPSSLYVRRLCYIKTGFLDGSLSAQQINKQLRKTSILNMKSHRDSNYRSQCVKC